MGKSDASVPSRLLITAWVDPSLQWGTSSVGKVSGLQPFSSAAVVEMIELAINIANMNLLISILRMCSVIVMVASR